jgi:putative transposase
MKKHSASFSVELMSRVLNVSRSGYYKWLNISNSRMQKEQTLIEEINDVFNKSDQTYGSPRIAVQLNKQGITVSKTTVARLMNKNNIAVKRKKSFVHTTDSNHKYKPAENLLNRDFVAHRPNEVWVSDITYIPIGYKKFAYLTVFLDLFDRAIVGWELSTSMTAKLTTVNALKKALSNRGITKSFKLMIHSDRGVQYACSEFRELLVKYNCVQSMSRKGDCWDNAVAESFFKSIKSEKIDRFNIHSFSEAYDLVFKYIEGWYNTKRIHSALDGMAPMEFFYKNFVSLAA